MNAPSPEVVINEIATVVQGHFKGIAVVIDDEVESEAEIGGIIQAIKDAGGHVITMKALPDVATDLDNFAGAAFFILDWNLTGERHGVKLSEALEADELRQKVEFLTKLQDSRHAPVFIFTNEDPDTVREALDASYPEGSAHILIEQKGAVGSRVYEILNEWAKGRPSVLTLKSWEQENRRAINAVFKDLHDKNDHWPVFLWQMFKADHVLAPDELGRLITRLVTSRMQAPTLDLDPFVAELDERFRTEPDSYKAALMKVLESERFLRKERLDSESFSTGDVFVETNAQGKDTYYINLRAECDCIKHPGVSPGHMHLLSGYEATDIDVDPTYGQVHEQHNEAVVFAMYEGKHIRFKFKPPLKLKEFTPTWRQQRIGRLLPPFLTRLLERYASYFQRPGIPRVPSALVPLPPVATTENPDTEAASASGAAEAAAAPRSDTSTADGASKGDDS